MGKKVTTIVPQLSPSGTSRMATVTIVDNIVRAVPNLISFGKDLSVTNTQTQQKLSGPHNPLFHS